MCCYKKQTDIQTCLETNANMINILTSKSSARYYYFSFFCFHLVAMSSTICNMLVYGWLNENIASQSHIFRDIRCSVLPCQITLNLGQVEIHCNSLATGSKGRIILGYFMFIPQIFTN